MSTTEVSAYVDSGYDDEVHVRNIHEELARIIARRLIADGLIRFERTGLNQLEEGTFYRYRAHLLVAEKAK